jgi:ectoine hydroxylase-related dioxygenase (phytanoyl-CoA dioxygenase family)
MDAIRRGDSRLRAEAAGAAISAEAARKFAEDGFTILEAAIASDELVWLRGIYDRLFAARRASGDADFHDFIDREHEGEGSGLFQILYPERDVPELFRTRYYRRTRAAAATLLRTPADRLTVFGHMMVKAPMRGPETPWHQDEAFMDPGWESDGLSVWLPLEGASVESGCLHFVPGTHRGDVLEHRSIGSRALTTTAAVEGAVACPLRCGDASVHDMRTLHYAGPNLTDDPRRAFVLVFRTQPRRAKSPVARPWLEPE